MAGGALYVGYELLLQYHRHPPLQRRAFSCVVSIIHVLTLYCRSVMLDSCTERKCARVRFAGEEEVGEGRGQGWGWGGIRLAATLYSFVLQNVGYRLLSAKLHHVLCSCLFCRRFVLNHTGLLFLPTVLLLLTNF